MSKVPYFYLELIHCFDLQTFSIIFNSFLALLPHLSISSEIWSTLIYCLVYSVLVSLRKYNHCLYLYLFLLFFQRFCSNWLTRYLIQSLFFLAFTVSIISTIRVITIVPILLGQMACRLTYFASHLPVVRCSLSLFQRSCQHDSLTLPGSIL